MVILHARVHRALHLDAESRRLKASQAADAVADIIEPPFPRFVREFGITDHLTADINHVHLVLFNQKIRYPRFLDPADDTELHIGVGTDHIRESRIQCPVFAGRRKQGSDVVQRAVGEVDVVHARFLQFSCHEDVVFFVGAALFLIRCGKAHGDREVLAYGLTDRGHDFQQETASSHDGSAVFIGTVVDNRTEKGTEQCMGMARMDFNRITSGFLCPECGVAIQLHIALNILFRHLDRCFKRIPDMGNRGGAQRHPSFIPAAVGKRTALDQLNGELAVIGMQCIRKLFESGQAAVVEDPENRRIVKMVLIDFRRFGGDEADASLCHAHIVFDDLIAQRMICRVDVVCFHRRQEDAVFNRHAAECDR